MHVHVCACILTVMQKEKEKYLTAFTLERNFRSQMLLVVLHCFIAIQCNSQMN